MLKKKYDLPFGGSKHSNVKTTLSTETSKPGMVNDTSIKRKKADQHDELGSGEEILKKHRSSLATPKQASEASELPPRWDEATGKYSCEKDQSEDGDENFIVDDDRSDAGDFSLGEI